MRILIVVCLFLAPQTARAQWWPFAPQDYEDCVAQAEKSELGKEARAAQVAECDVKFAGRRKPGGGYTYYDFMQDRHFDIAGPNPTPEELKRFDQEYTAYLERQRHAAIVAALADKKRQQAEAAEIRSVMTEKTTTGSILATPPAAPPRRAPAVHAVHAGHHHCDTRLSCTWTDLSDGVRGLFGPPPRTRPPAKI
ncbi:MAG: hypothetical protein ACLP1D_04230 [Xanthobacteraceae bacterium]